MVKNARDHVTHRRLSLKLTLRNSPRTIAQLLCEPVYRKLASESSSGEAVAAIRQDVEYLRANGEEIRVQKNQQGEYVYHLDDDVNIHLDTTGLNMGLLMPLLIGKDYHPTRNFATMGMNKALAAGKAKQTSTALVPSIPAGDSAPIVASAVQYHRVLDMDYQSVKDSRPVRRFIEPWALEIHAGEFYVRGLKLGISPDETTTASSDGAPAVCSMHAVGERLYKLSRMTRCEVTKHKTRYPIADSNEHDNDFFTPVTAVVAVKNNAAPALTVRAQRLSHQEIRHLMDSDNLQGLNANAQYVDSHAFYLLPDTDKSALLDDLAFYGSLVTLIAPSELVHELYERAAYLNELLKDQSRGEGEEKNRAYGSHRPSPIYQKRTHSTQHTRVDLALSRRESYYSYLLKNGPSSLKDIAEHFSVTPIIAYRELKDLYATEISSGGYYIAPYDLDLPIWEDEDDIDPHQLITAVQHSDTEEYADRCISFTLAEIISLLSAIDSLLSVASGEHRHELTELRTRLTHAAADAGYGSALWPAPYVRCAPAVIQSLVQAIDRHEKIEIEYSQMSNTGEVQLIHTAIKPFTIDPQLNPLVAAMNECDELRTYRLDRISAVKLTGVSFPKTPVRQWKKDYKKRSIEFHGQSVDITLTREGRWALEELPGAYLLRDDENGLLMRAQISNVHWLRTLLLRLGRACVSLSPTSLAAQIAPDIDALVRHYDQAEL